MATVAPEPTSPPPRKLWSFRRAVVRGLALILPPILTIVIFVWMAKTVQVDVLEPVTNGARDALVWWCLRDVRDVPDEMELRNPRLEFDGRAYVRLDSGEYVPQAVTDALQTQLPGKPLPATARVVYEDYVNARFLRPTVVVPLFLAVFLAVLYLLGKLFAAGLGGFIESGIRRLPLVRSVYTSVKKVTDLVLVEGQVEYKRVVAIEFPRPGVWSVGLVMGEGMRAIGGAASEACVTVAVPGSPLPFTGNVVTVPKTAAHDLNLTIDEALQFFISCGVVVPARELPNKAERREVIGVAQDKSLVRSDDLPRETPRI